MLIDSIFSYAQNVFRSLLQGLYNSAIRGKGLSCKPVDISLHIFLTVYLAINTFCQIIGINDSLNFRTV